MNARSVHWEPNEKPTEEMLGKLTDILAGHPAKWMIWEGAPHSDTLRDLQKIGVESVVFDPCGNTPDDGDYISIMRSNLKQLHRLYETP
jgi:zinc transport system substrate-binding protein